MNNVEPTTENTPDETKATATPRDSGMPTLTQLTVALGVLALVFGSSYIPDIQKRFSDQELAEPPKPTTREVARERINHFANVNITADAAYVWDVTNQRALYNKNAGAQLPLASLTKLMTALVAYERLGEDIAIAIPLEAILEEGDSGFSSGQEFEAGSLIDLTLISSSNDGAHALAAAAGNAVNLERNHTNKNVTESFLELMNRRAEEIGLSQTYFTNPTGLDASVSRSGSYGSARDMAFLMEHIVIHQSEILERTTNQSLDIHDEVGNVLTATNTNEIATDIPGLIGSKTGFTALAGGNLVVAFDVGLNHPVVISVLGSTRDGRFEDVRTLVQSTQKTFLND